MTQTMRKSILKRGASLVGAALLLASATLASASETQTRWQSVAMAPTAVPAALNQQLAKDWGLQVLGIRQSAAGYMLDFRYRVLDPEKARAVLDRTIPAKLEVARSGATLHVPRPPTTGRLRGGARFPQKDRNYFMFFGNPGKHVQPGDKVSVVIGDFRADDITVQ
jgi:hypothetical protein